MRVWRMLRNFDLGFSDLNNVPTSKFRSMRHTLNRDIADVVGVLLSAVIGLELHIFSLCSVFGGFGGE